MNRELRLTLLSLQRKDLGMREQLLREGRLFGFYADEMQAVHVANAQDLDAIIEQHGWPGVTLVGPEGGRAAWMIAQHAICTPDLQRKFRDCLQDAVVQGCAPARQLALLTDRIRFNEGRPQCYGTVYDWNADGELTCNVEDGDELDARRAKVGLPPFDEALERERAVVLDEGGGPPDDYADYRRRADDWARRVGWRE